MILDAVCRNLAIIGEAARKVHPEFQASHAQLPWRKMGDLRNVLIHAYDGVDPEIVWGIVTRDIPDLLAVSGRFWARVERRNVESQTRACFKAATQRFGVLNP